MVRGGGIGSFRGEFDFGRGSAMGTKRGGSGGDAGFAVTGPGGSGISVE